MCEDVWNKMSGLSFDSLLEKMVITHMHIHIQIYIYTYTLMEEIFASFIRENLISRIRSWKKNCENLISGIRSWKKFRENLILRIRSCECVLLKGF